MTTSIYGGPGYSTGSTASMNATGMTKPKAPSGYKTYENMTPEQMELLKQLMNQLGPDSFLAQIAGGDLGAFEEMEAPALKQFSEIQGNIANRFSGMGLGGMKSSGFKNVMNTAASDFAQQLQSNRLNIRNQAIKDLLGLGNQLLGQEPYGLVEKQEKSNPWASIIGTGVGAAGGFALGGPAGAVTGAKVGYGVGSKF